MKWAIELSQYHLLYRPKTAIKAQALALADFVAEFTPLDEEEKLVNKKESSKADGTSAESSQPKDMWQLRVDEALNQKGAGANVDVIVGTKELKIAFFVVDTTSTTYNALLNRDWIHQSLCVPSTLHQQLALWNEEGFMDTVEADPRPFLSSAMCFEARDYHDHLGPFTFFGVNPNGRRHSVTTQRLIQKGLANSLEDWNRPFVLNLQNYEVYYHSTRKGSSCNNPIHYKKIVDILGRNEALHAESSLQYGKIHPAALKNRKRVYRRKY
ncbi:hypothetical protein L3X38_027395 [Prunus dulcis]|uniref:Uncharacterized protein n=1 Tax=Prunus dulcis TaxID=3755 RepID=A0AAD4Z0D7_PRUDU|nr:hypothetical protein L3X38_027395 [Prunus dulcis]